MAEAANFLVAISTKFDNTGITKGIAAIKNFAIAGVSIGAVAGFMADVTRRAAENETAINKLTMAMKNQGIYTNALKDDYLAFAQELQKTTKYADEEIMSVMQLLTTFGLHDQQLKRATRSILDLSSAYGMDLNSAAMLIGKAFAGNAETLKRYGITVDDSVSKSGKFDAVMRQLEMRFGGGAQAEMNTYAGKVANLKNQYDEMAETIGRILIPVWEYWIPKIKAGVEWLDKLFNAGQKLDGSYKSQSKHQYELIALEEQMKKAVIAGDKAKQDQINNAIIGLVRQEKEEKKKQDEIVKTSVMEKQIKEEQERDLKKQHAKERTEQRKFSNQITDYVRQANEEQKRINEERLTKTLNTTSDFTNKTSNVYKGYFDLLSTKTENQMNKDLDTQEAIYNDRKAWIEANVTDEDKRSKMLAELETTYAATVANIKQNADNENRKRMRKMKAFSISEAIINTAVGATKAYKDYGWPWGLVAAALVIAAGAVEVAQIKAQEFAQGGMALGKTFAMFGEAGAEIALPLNNPNTIRALSSALALAGGGGGGAINVYLPPITTRGEARRMGEIVGQEIYRRVRNNRKV